MGVDDGAGADETGRGSGNLGGETFGGGSMSDDAIGRLEFLSNEERLVLQSLINGRGGALGAHDLFISRLEFDLRLKRIYLKLGVQTAVDAVGVGLEGGLQSGGSFGSMSSQARHPSRY